MSSDEADKKNVEENTTQDTASSAEENEEKEDVKEDKVNNKPAAKKKGADPPKIKQPAKKRVKTEQAAEKENKKEEKKEEKKKVEVEEDDEEESADEHDVENHKAVPLLDQPLEVSGSRKRKEVQRFKPVEPEDENKEVKIPEGKGKALGDIARVEFNIQRAKPDDLKLLHRLCFGKPGKAVTVKKTLKKFNGYEFDVDSEEFEKKKSNVEKSFKKVTVSHLKNICNIIDVEKGGSKDDLVQRIITFLTCPVDSGKKLPGGGRSKRTNASSKNYDEGEESFKSKKRGKGKKKSEESDESDKDDKSDEEDEDDVKENDDKKDDAQTTEESEHEQEDEKEDEEKPKKGAAKKGKKAAEVADKKAPPKKRAAAKKAAEKKSDSEGDEADESEDEEPLSKKSKTPPTDEEIKTYVKSLLEGANLELITMKKVCQDVYAHYPDFDLGHKKDFIKSTVKSLISS